MSGYLASSAEGLPRGREQGMNLRQVGKAPDVRPTSVGLHTLRTLLQSCDVVYLVKFRSPPPTPRPGE